MGVVDIHRPEPGTKAIDVRRAMLEIKEVQKALNSVECKIFQASTQKQICTISPDKLMSWGRQAFNSIATDCGYIIPRGVTEAAEICARFVKVLRDYYGQLTAGDIVLAFELANIGELDDYLPKDAHGEPDSNHYQNFNVKFIGKIVGAYIKRRTCVINKAYNAIPAPNVDRLPTDVSKWRNEIMNDVRFSYLRYKYSGRMEFAPGAERGIYEHLYACGWCYEVKETDEDRRKAYAKFMRRALNGIMNAYTVADVRRKGHDAPELDFEAYEVARAKEIRRAFDEMIKEEFNINLIL